MKTSEEISLIAPAFIEALGEIGIVKKDSKNPFLKNKYASLDAIIEATKPILAKHKLVAFQIVNDFGIETIIMHESGEWIGSDCLKIIAEASKGLSAAQAVGVATTYAKRYQLGAMLNVSTEEDTDGQIVDNKDLKPVEAKALPNLMQKLYGDTLSRILAGETDLLQKCEKAFTITEEQRVNLAAAVKTTQAKVIEKQAPETPAVTPKSDNKKIFE